LVCIEREGEDGAVEKRRRRRRSVGRRRWTVGNAKGKESNANAQS
jgi:hypothetical protein